VYLKHEFTPKDYEFPRLYIVSERSKEVLTLFPEKGCYVRGEEKGGIKAGLVPYESGWGKIFDLVKAEVTRSFGVLVPWLDNKILYVKEGVKVSLIEVSGVQASLVAREGEEVTPESVIAYVVTNKGETRTIRAELRGVIIYVAWEPASVPERYVYLVARPEDIKKLSPCR
jgi:hypothetical protein